MSSDKIILLPGAVDDSLHFPFEEAKREASQLFVNAASSHYAQDLNDLYDDVLKIVVRPRTGCRIVCFLVSSCFSVFLPSARAWRYRRSLFCTFEAPEKGPFFLSLLFSLCLLFAICFCCLFSGCS